MTGSCCGLVCTMGNVTELSLASPWVVFGPAAVVTSDRASLSDCSMSGPLIALATRSYHMACRPEESATIQGWKRSFMKVWEVCPLLCWGAFHVWLPSMEKLKKMRVAFAFVPPARTLPTRHTRYHWLAPDSIPAHMQDGCGPASGARALA